MSTKRTSVDTRYKKVSTLKKDSYMQIGQYKKGKEGLSRLLHKEDGVNTFLHGERVDQRFCEAHRMARQGLVIPCEPQQLKMVVGQVASRHLGAIARICESAIEKRVSKIVSLRSISKIT